MSISPVSSNIALAISDVQAASAQNQVLRLGQSSGSDGDSDDNNAASSAIRPTVNTRGQTVGTIINTTA